MQKEPRAYSHINSARDGWHGDRSAGHSGHHIPTHHPQAALEPEWDPWGKTSGMLVQRPPKAGTQEENTSQCADCPQRRSLSSRQDPVYWSPGASKDRQEMGFIPPAPTCCIPSPTSGPPDVGPSHLSPRAQIQSCCFLCPVALTGSLGELFSYKDYEVAYASCQDPD